MLGLGLRPCEVADKDRAHLAVRAVQQEVARFDGTITRLICDDKGTRFLIAFGLPGHANEDDESRAVLSSLEVLTALSVIPAYDGSPKEEREGEKSRSDSSTRDSDGDSFASLGVAIGITTGRVFCGEAGSESRKGE